MNGYRHRMVVTLSAGFNARAVVTRSMTLNHFQHTFWQLRLSVSHHFVGKGAWEFEQIF
ncbi:Uncharacterised protein [Vibrio cholerae]|nr:Uncharacterised protein [Vibrio cholerae]